CEPAAFGMEAQRLDPSRRSVRLVPVVLPLLHGPAHAGRPAADRAVESNPAVRAPGADTLRARRFALSAATAAGAVALGLRQPQDLTGLFRRYRRGARGAASPARHDDIDRGDREARRQHLPARPDAGVEIENRPENAHRRNV